ncbi:MAG: hypothetical protein M1831_002592 [Alyxoria varia]|nr:MAG: hypothetical protein M1831_002592 [Alyxoria varia]
MKLALFLFSLLLQLATAANNDAFVWIDRVKFPSPPRAVPAYNERRHLLRSMVKWLRGIERGEVNVLGRSIDAIMPDDEEAADALIKSNGGLDPRYGPSNPVGFSDSFGPTGTVGPGLISPAVSGRQK